MNVMLITRRRKTMGQGNGSFIHSFSSLSYDRTKAFSKAR